MTDILEQLVSQGVITPAQRERARAAQAAGAPLDEALLSQEDAQEERVLRSLGEAFGVPWADVEGRPPAREFLAAFPARVLMERKLLPLREEADGVTLVAGSRLFDTTGLDELRLASGREVRLAVAPSAEIDRWLKRCLGVGADTVQSMVADGGVQVVDHEPDDGVDLSEAAQDASIVKFVNEILVEAINLRATDVHFEPFEDELRVRYRVDGVLQEAAIPGDVRRFRAAIISRLKILSHLDIAEKRLPQDGRIKLRIEERDIDVRVSVIPMLHGEGVVLRLLDRGAALLGMESLGMSAADCASFERLLDLPHGIILVTGPTGSGKTTTLYAALSRINKPDLKIVTIEDPVEYQLRGINQIQVSSKAGLTFARGLRSILRHDPDVVLVGEIRDLETAEIAVQASLTGHLVFSTLHTNDAPGALTRLVDMGVEPYLVASSLEAVLAQRLVRVICPECRERLPEAEVERARRQYDLKELAGLWAGRGCRRCQGLGYRGRTGIFELMMVTDDVRGLILDRPPAGVIRKAAQTHGMKSLREDGWRVAAEGRTTVEEVLRATKDERLAMNGWTTPAASGAAGAG
ncbi:MAG TPA: ATPase, T2SS/T4P/T4SS family [Candidatus Brocadiia bacterium]|nr:ATPase, T2SS/T4P/T4SS family [Candidatus Brocadiia bacterium]